MRVVAVRATDYKKWIGGLIMLSFSLIGFLRWQASGELFFILLSFRDLIAAIFLIRREEASITSSRPSAIIAYISSALPLIYLSAPYGLETKTVKLVADLFTIVGFLIVTWATIDLGTKLGVSPAKRGTPITKGLYKFLKHPMYAGYAIAQLGWIFVNPWNIFIYFISITLIFIRIKAENNILES
jgi:protein-S-isoprenylcysteine O-methyltransferase Ste14